MRTSRIKVHCSQLGALMANAKDNSPLTPYQEGQMIEFLNREKPLTENMHTKFLYYSRKQANYNPKKLTSNAKSTLIDIYAWNKYRKLSLSYSKEVVAVQKGQVAEDESIKLLSSIDGRTYEKNKRRYRNKYLTGIPDIVYKVRGKKRVIDVKTSVDLVSFLENIDKNLTFQYFFQLLGYMELVGADEGEVCFCLVNLPPEMIKQQVNRLKAQSYLAGNSDERTEEIINEFKNSMYFDDIPEKRRVIRFKVKADKKVMADVYKRVEIGREWLKKLIKAHIFGKKNNAQTLFDIFRNQPSALQGSEV
jgi:hypothetical protein